MRDNEKKVENQTGKTKAEAGKREKTVTATITDNRSARQREMDDVSLELNWLEAGREGRRATRGSRAGRDRVGTWKALGKLKWCKYVTGRAGNAGKQ